MLSQDQQAEFGEWGLLRLPNALPTFDAQRMVDLVWSQLAAEHGIHREAPQTWTIERPIGFKPILGTDVFRRLPAPVHAATDDLVGPGQWQPAKHWKPLVTFSATDGGWDVPTSGWHYDRPFELHDLERTPGLNIFGFLTSTRPRGGGTLVLAGSHHLVRRYTAHTGLMVHSKVVKAALGAAHPWLHGLWSVRGQRQRDYLHEEAVVDGIRLRVIELTGEPGEVYLMNASMLHNAGPNVLAEPRMMIVQKVRRPDRRPAQDRVRQAAMPHSPKPAPVRWSWSRCPAVAISSGEADRYQ